MKICVLCLILLLECMYSCLAQGTYESCCLSYNKEPKQKMKNKAVSYRIQETDGGCNLRAVVIQYKKAQMRLCADPKQKWVQTLMETIKKKQGLKKKN
ncbi:C-C motif chemokine 25b [Clarias gariepinus]|uniref:C-C motif chemokine 25b n=1 Tax=Clarias gariepinus TaxID=13013 RepID=UPI00234D1143|nr:C-C motif chemokine 25b [Clarias gariepinus]